MSGSNRRDAFALREYARALEAVSEDLQSDTSALIAQAQQAIDQSERLRAERAVYV
jgi:hypothetical protein